jgi:SAM-dependent methyltransferase
MTEEQRARTLARFAEHRAAWGRNRALRSLYEGWYTRIRAHLPAPTLGPAVEIGSGPGFAREVLPELRLSDLVRAPWHDYEIDAASRLPFADGEVGALVLFDVLHHLASPVRFFEEAARVLARGGRVVLCEPYVSPLSYPVYRWLHEESLAMPVDPFAEVVSAAVGRRAKGPSPESPTGAPPAARDPFDSNQAIPTLMFGRAAGRATFARRFPSLEVRAVDRFAGLAYPSSGGFGRAPLLPFPLWNALAALEARLPPATFHAIGFRMLAVVEKR